MHTDEPISSRKQISSKLKRNTRLIFGYAVPLYHIEKMKDI